MSLKSTHSWQVLRGGRAYDTDETQYGCAAPRKIHKRPLRALPQDVCGSDLGLVGRQQRQADRIARADVVSHEAFPFKRFAVVEVDRLRARALLNDPSTGELLDVPVSRCHVSRDALPEAA